MGHFLRKGAKIKESELILKIIKVEFLFALNLGGINECRLKKITVGDIFFLQIFEKINYIWNYMDPCKEFLAPPLVARQSSTCTMYCIFYCTYMDIFAIDINLSYFELKYFPHIDLLSYFYVQRPLFIFWSISLGEKF